MFEKIQYKMQGKPELGRILRDEKYDRQTVEEKEVALWAFVKDERSKERAKIKSIKLEVKPQVKFNS